MNILKTKNFVPTDKADAYAQLYHNIKYAEQTHSPLPHSIPLFPVTVQRNARNMADTNSVANGTTSRTAFVFRFSKERVFDGNR